MNEKMKNQAGSVNKTLFLLLWGGSYAAAWLGLLFISRIFPGGMSSEATMLIVAVIFMVMPVTQKLLLRHLVHLETRGWLRLTFVGYLAGTWLCMSLPSLIVSNSMVAAVLFTPAGILQWFALRNRVDSAWLWIVAAAVSAMALMTIMPQRSINDIETYLWLTAGALVQGIITGLTMLWLLQNRREKGKYAAARLTV